MDSYNGMTNKQGGVAYAYASDPEAGAAYSKRLARKLITRRGKIILGLSVAAIVLLLLQPSSFVSAPHEREQEPSDFGLHGFPEKVQNDDSWGWNPFKPTPEKVAETAYGDYIAPMDPDVSKLPDPDTLFPEIDIQTHLRAPSIKEFPDGSLRTIVSPKHEFDATGELENEKKSAYEVPKDSYAANWVGPRDWNAPRGRIPKVQWEGFQGGRDRWENDEQREAREKRRNAVKRGFVHAWQAYKDHAWGHDEVKPVSRSPSDPFNNWGASIIDTLDTLLIMGLSDEYNLAREHVNQVNFRWVGGRDWEDAWVSIPSEGGQVTVLPRDKFVGLPVFETTIRYMGGLLGAYDLSGDKLMLERAIDLAEVLGKAFNTETGIPAGRIDPGLKFGGFRSGQVSIAEAGSMSLEFMRLSQITGNRTWFDYAQRAMDYLEQKVIPQAKHSPLIPLWFYPRSIKSIIDGPLCFGGLADSYYEYLIKTYKLLGGSEVAEQWKDVYEGSIDKAKETIYVDINVVPGVDLLAIGKLENGRLINEIEHLTCFAGAMLGLGAKLLDRSSDMDDAERVTQSCYWLSAATPTGLQPEVVEFYLPGDENMWETKEKQNNDRNPEEANDSNSHIDHDGTRRWNVDNTEVHKRLKGSPPGTNKVTTRGLNRPETIESIFYMYRLTGDRKWQDKGWQMYTSWVNTAKFKGGFSSIDDVTVEKDKIRYTDNMESFTFAETLKYHYLLQSEPDLISLDDYVLNTEAHPFIAASGLSPGDSGLWRPPTGASAELGIRGQGTDAQKWQRFDVIEKAHGPVINKGHGGGGMGGGGGDPNFRPKPPPELGRVGISQGRPM